MTDLNVINNALAQFDPFETDEEKKALAKAVSALVKENKSFDEITARLSKAREEADRAVMKRRLAEEKKRIARLETEFKKRFKTEIKAKIKETNPIFCELGSEIVAVWKNATYATWESYPSWDDEPQPYYRVSRRLSDEPLFVADFTLDSEAEFDNFIAIFGIPCIQIDRNEYDVIAVWPNGNFLARDKTGETSDEWRVVSDFDKAFKIGLETYWWDKANCTQDIDEALAKIANGN